MRIININDQRAMAFPCDLGGVKNVTPENNWPLIAASGGRYEPEFVPQLQDGYTRISQRLVDDDGINGKWEVADRLITDVKAEAVAAEAERRNTPIVYDQPIEAPVLVLTSHDAGVGVGLFADDDGVVLAMTYHASPVPAPSVIRQRILDAKAERAALKSAVEQKRAVANARIAAAQNVPALRAAVLDLQAQINALNARIK